MTKDALVSLVKERYDIARKNQEPKFNRFSEFDNIYHNKLKNSDPNIPSQVFNPIVWSFIETIITRMLAKTPTIAYKPREQSDETNSQIFTDLFSYWFDKCNIYPKIVQWVKNCLIYGTGIVKVDWYTSKPREINSYVFGLDGEPMVDENGQYMTQTTQTIEYDDPRLTVVNMYDIFVDPSCETIENADWIVYQYWANHSDLELENEKAAEYGKKIYNKHELDSIKREKAANYNQYEGARREATGLDASKVEDKTVDRCLIWEMWEDDRLVVVADGMRVIRDSKNPYWHGKKPFIRLVDSIVPKEFWGKGEIEPIEKLLHALNTTQNQRITNVNRVLSPMWKAKPTVDDDELNFIDNGIIHVNDLQDAELIPMPDVTSRAYQEAEAIKEDMQRALGVTDYVQGVQTPDQTAKEVEIKTAQSNARFAHKVKLFEEMALKDLGEIFYQLYQQYTTKERVVRIVGNKGEQYIRVTPQDIIGEYDVIPESESSLAVDSEAEFTKYFNLFSVLRQYAHKQVVDPRTGIPQTTGFLNEQELVKDLIKRSGNKDPERYFIDEAQGVANAGQGQGDQTGQRQAPFLPALIGTGGDAGMAGVGEQNPY